MKRKNALSTESQLLKIFLRSKTKDYFCQEIKAGEEIFSLEKPQQNIFYSLGGIAKLSRIDCTGRETFVGLLPEKSFIGLSLLLNKSESSYRAVAQTPVTLISTTITQFRQKLQESPQLWTPIFYQALSRSLTAQMTIESRLLKTSEARLVAFLLVLCEDFGVETETGIKLARSLAPFGDAGSLVKIKLKLTHQNLADWTYINRPGVTKILGQLRQRQIVSIEQQQITLHNPNILRDFFDIPYYLSTKE